MKKKSLFGSMVGFSLAAAWFGTHCGSGFATGAQAVSFWVRFGAVALILPIISVAVMCLSAYFQWDFCREFKLRTYREYGDKLFEPYDKIFGTLYKLGFLMMMAMGISAVLAGAGSLLQTTLNLPYMAGVAVVAVLIILFNMFGTSFLRKIASVLSLVLVAVIIAVACCCIFNPQNQFGAVVGSWEVQGSLGAAVWSAVLYASFQCLILGCTLNMTDDLDTGTDSKAAAVFGLILNGAMMVLITCMLLGYYPAVSGEALPVLSIIETLNLPFLKPLYSFMLFLAFITTGVTGTGGVLTRVENIGENVITNANVRRGVYCLLIILVCIGLAQFGLIAIIQKGYSFMGYIGIPLVVLPSIIVAPIKLKNKRKTEMSTK